MNRIGLIAIIFSLSIYSAESIVCNYCAGCIKAPTGNASGSVCLTFNTTCNFGKTYVSSLALVASNANSTCGVHYDFGTTVAGIPISCAFNWSCCYTDLCNKCPSTGCTSFITKPNVNGATRSGEIYSWFFLFLIYSNILLLRKTT